MQQQQPTFVISVEIIEKDIYKDLLEEISVIRNPLQAKNLMAVELVVANSIIIIQIIILIQNLVSHMLHLLFDRHFGH